MRARQTPITPNPPSHHAPPPPPHAPPPPLPSLPRLHSAFFDLLRPYSHQIHAPLPFPPPAHPHCCLPPPRLRPHHHAWAALPGLPGRSRKGVSGAQHRTPPSSQAQA